MYHARTINQMIVNAERYGKHLLVDLAGYSVPQSIRIIRARTVKGVTYGYGLATGEWRKINPDTLREL